MALTALFTRDELKDHEGITGTDLDNLIDNLRTRVYAACNRFTRRTLAAPDAAETIYLDGSGHPDLRLPDFPVITLTSVHEDTGREFGSSSLLTSGTDFLSYADRGILRRISIPEGIFATKSPTWIESAGTIKVVYRAGYTDSTLPEDLKEAALIWAGAILARRAGHGVASRSQGAFAESFTPEAVPAAARALLAPFRRWPVRGVRS